MVFGNINQCQQETPMIQIETAQQDAAGHGDFQEIGPGVYQDTTGQVVISDGSQSILVTITPE
jgi:hypothetical protein